MKSSITKFLAFIGLALLITNASAQELFADNFAAGNSDGKATASIISSVKNAAPGQPFDVAIEIDHPEGWHSYYKNAGAAGSALKFDLELPDGYTASEILWPVPHVAWYYKILSFSYGEKAYFLTTITPAADATGTVFNLGASIRIQMCKDDICLPPETITASTEILLTDSPVVNADSTKIIEAAKQELPTTLEDWKFSLKQEEGNLIVTLETKEDLSKLKKPVFITDAKIIDIEKAHQMDVIDGGYKLTVALKEDAEVPSKLTGIFTSESHKVIDGVHGVLFSIGSPAMTEAESPTVAVDEKSESSQQERLALVPDNPVITIPISRLNDDGYVVNDAGVVIPRDQLFVDENGNLVDKDGQVTGKKEETTFLLAMALIFGGGLILNLMPCVFPVLGVKVLGFAQLAGNDPKKIKMHGLVFTLGVLVSMWILAGTILAIKASTGDAIAWGSQMKSPIFVGSMIILLALFAMNLFGIFEVGTSLTSAGGNLQQKKGYQGSFFSGILTTLIATPCGAPLLATAMTYTLQQSAIVALFLFTIFGLGVAFPYLILSFFPKLIDKLPRPGNWMVTFKKSMAFPLLATVVFLLTVFIKQTGEEGIILMLWSLVIFATAAFVYGTWSPRFTPKIRRYVVGFALTIILATGAGHLAWQAMNTERSQIAAIDHEWTGWEPTMVDNTRKEGRIVWLDYTADW